METIKAHDIRFVVQSSGNPAVPHSSSWPYCSEESGERVVFLSQMIYLHFHFHLTIGVAEDVAYDLRQQFSKELPVGILPFPPFIFHTTLAWQVCYPDAFKMCPILARVRTMVVGTEATLLVASYMAGRGWFFYQHLLFPLPLTITSQEFHPRGFHLVAHGFYLWIRIPIPWWIK
jgi:hypothetical protein